MATGISLVALELAAAPFWLFVLQAWIHLVAVEVLRTVHRRHVRRVIKHLQARLQEAPP